MRIKAQALVALLLLCLPAIPGARGDAPRESPFQQARDRLAITGAGYGDFLFVRRLVMAHPEICRKRYWNPGGDCTTLLMCAASACSGACFGRSVGGASDVPDAEATLRLILGKTDTSTLTAINGGGASALECASRDTTAMDMLYTRYRKARRIPDMNRILYNAATGSGSPDLGVIRWLMAHGANPRWQDSQGYTIIQRAQQEGLPIVASTLQGN